MTVVRIWRQKTLSSAFDSESSLLSMGMGLLFFEEHSKHAHLL